jgi:2'-5' RNA ligase
MRLFVALDISEPIRERIARFMEGVRGFAPDVRWVRPESLHVTLKFIGNWRDEAVDEIKKVLAAVQLERTELSFREYGFFPTPKSARVFWVGIQAGPQLAELAKSIDESLSSLGIARETHAFSPHLTLARGGGGSGAPRRQRRDGPNHEFAELREKLSALPAPEFGGMTAGEFFLFESKLGPGGSRYTKLASFGLR